uniref:Uncharacterized protein n=2 Tax=viral metagenome TaxID=1070528 RepID=A0A6M3KP67_9ZZZZ
MLPQNHAGVSQALMDIDCLYFKDGDRCVHPGAPEPGKSFCLGRDDCLEYQFLEVKDADNYERAQVPGGDKKIAGGGIGARL